MYGVRKVSVILIVESGFLKYFINYNYINNRKLRWVYNVGRQNGLQCVMPIQ